MHSFFAEWMHKSWKNRRYYVYLYHCMKEFSVNGEERLKTGHAHPLSGLLKFWGACPACTLNRITKLRPEDEACQISGGYRVFLASILNWPNTSLPLPIRTWVSLPCKKRVTFYGTPGIHLNLAWGFTVLLFMRNSLVTLSSTRFLC